MMSKVEAIREWAQRKAEWARNTVGEQDYRNLLAILDGPPFIDEKTSSSLLPEKYVEDPNWRSKMYYGG